MTFRTFALRATFVLIVATLIAALWFYRKTFMLAFLAVVIAVLMSIIVGFLQRLKVPRGVAVAVAALVLIEAVSSVGFLLEPVFANLNELAQRLPLLSDQLTENYNALAARGDLVGRLLPPLTLELSGGALTQRLEETLGSAFTTGLPVLFRTGNFIVTLLANFFLVAVLAIFFVAEPKTYVRASLYLVPARHQPRLLALWSALYHTLRTWLSTLLVSVAITVLLVLLVLGPLGMPYVAEVALFAGLATFIPTVGALLPVVLIVLVLLAADPARIPLMVAAYLVIQLLESNVLTPALVRRQLNVPPAATLLTQIVAGLAFGLLGVVLAVPLLALVIVLVREVYSYGLLGLRGRSVPVELPPPPVHIHTRSFISRKSEALRQRFRSRK